MAVMDTPTRTDRTQDEAQKWVEVARSLAPLVEAEVAQAAEDKIITEKLVRAWKDAGLYSLLLPTYLGGAGVDDVTYLQVAEEIARQDASAGWVFANHLTGTLFPGMMLPREAFMELIGPNADGVACGSGAPQGVYGTAKPVEGGYLVECGPRFFGSGSQRATRVVSRVALQDEDGNELVGDDGQPKVVFIWVAPENVEWLNDWNPSGLPGSGSGSYRVKPHVLEEKWMGIKDVEGFPDEPAFTQGNTAVATLHHVGLGLGLAKRFIQEMVKATEGRRRGDIPAVDQYPLFLADFVRVTSLYGSARAFALDAYQELWDAAAEHRMTDLHVMHIEQASLHLYRVLSDIVSTATLWAGSDIIPKDGIFARLTTNAHVAMAHLLVGPQHAVHVAPAILQEWREGL